jgi:excisionase family DNA binding protein
VDDHRGERRSGRDREQRLTLAEAAQVLGTSKDAVRMRVKRGTLRSEKGGDGRVYVWVNVNADADPNAVHSEPHVEAWRELIEELRDRVRSLEDANRENRRIIAALTQRIPELESPAPQEPPDRPPNAEAGFRREETPPGGEEAQEGTERPWWRRVFGG